MLVEQGAKIKISNAEQRISNDEVTFSVRHSAFIIRYLFILLLRGVISPYRVTTIF